LNTWLVAAIGVILYLSSRRFAPEEEAELSETFGPAWDDYCRTVTIPLAIGRRSSLSARCHSARSDPNALASDTSLVTTARRRLLSPR
jgi:hypothetical protein